MSWILGSIGTFDDAEKARISSIHERPITVVQSRNVYLAAGGISATCLHGQFNPTQSTTWDGWIVVGLGIRWQKEGCSFYSASAWSALLAAVEPEFLHLDGHFVALRYNDRELQMFTDQLGLRGMYVSKTPGGFVLSTRLDWVARLSNNSEIDLEAIGPQWLAFNQISCSSPVRHVIRVGPGGKARCTPASFEFRDALWSPQAESREPIDFECALRPFLAPVEVPQEAISFGLSGGLDSRVMLAMFYSMGKPSVKLHVVGDPLNPDVILSRAIGQKLNLEHHHEQYVLPNPDTLLAQMKEYLAQIYVTNPASAVMDTNALYRVCQKTTLLLDASFGELARRQSMNRLLMMGSKALRQHSAEQMSDYMTVHRAEIFNRDAMATMNKGFVEQIQWYLDATSPHAPVTDEDFVDLMTVRTRFPNYSGVEQARTDSFVAAYMPFLQPSVLRSAFRLPLHLKRKGRLFRRLITRYCPQLTSLPLAKGGTIYPFGFSTVPAHLWTAVKKKLGNTYEDKRIREMLGKLKEYSLDLVHSQELQSCPAYDVQKVRSLVERYYSGEHRLEHEVDWWLSFEFWRQAMKH